MADGVRVCLVGELRAEVGAKTYRAADLGSRKGRMLLAAVAADPARTVSAAALAEALWPGERPDSADATIASLVSRLRKTLGAEIISGGRSGYRLGARPGIDVDLAAAARLVAEAEHRLDAAQPGLAAAAAQAALATLDAGRVLDDLDDAEWVARARAEQASLLRRARHTTVTASLTTGDHRTAQRAAEAAMLADPLDETAVRGLLSALAAAGDVGAALAVYERLRAELADQLGADPSPATQRLHESILRGDVQAGRLAAPRPNVRPALLGLAGRDAELAALQRLWAGAAAGTGALVLLAGEPGAGKTRLAEELAGVVSATGGAVLVARCYEAEKGLFLQPLVEAISTAAATWPAAVVRSAATEHLDALARLVPELRAITSVVPARAGPADIERRRSMEAVSAFLRGLAAAQPLLLVLDDLHNAGRSTVELLHYLRIRLKSSPMLVVATVRSAEGAAVLAALDAVATTIEVGGLPEAGVRTLAATAGQAHLAGEIARRTRGNALFVVEILRGLAEGTALPESLRAAVLARVGGLGPVADRVLRGGAVLGASFDPRLAAQLSGTPVADALRCCEQALLAGLLVPAGRAYEFANDVLREVVYATTPEPTRLAHHARAVDMLAAFPEQVAEHASVTEDWPRAARAWLLAAERALERFATADAAALAKSARDAAARAGDAELSARALLIRGRASYANRDYATSWADLGAAVETARAAGDRRLEMVALREQSHDPHVALGRPPADSEQPMLECLRIAESLGDRTFEADILGRLAILATNRLDFVNGLQLAERALRVGRSVGRGRALVFGLDAAKTANAYLGEAGAVAEIVAELEPLERADGDLTLLQWTVFESFVVPMAAGDVPAAIARIEAALAINRRIGMAAFEPFFAAYLGWVYRLAGDLHTAAEVGARAVEQSREHRHAWWVATAAAMHATTLVALDRPADAARIVESALPLVEAPGAESYRLRCLAALAAATDSTEMRDRADALLHAIRAPDGCAWLLGADAYLSIAARWAADGDPGRAAEVLTPLRAAAARVPWPALRDLVPVAAH
jgi:DNA-binding SARP family transcriptional activator/energy-coupling factor transporter ATP-binding protein EcfA2